MRPSRYNFFFQVDDEAILAYNSLSTALAKLSAEEFAGLQDFFTDSRDDFFEAHAMVSFRDELLRSGFLVADEEDEIEQLRTLHTALKRQRQQTIGLTLVPTLDCNFRCNYCFSYARPERMGARVQEALLRLVEEKLPAGGALSVAWYGGEPTLCLDLIESLSADLHTLCDQKKAKFQPSIIVTNGYLLTEEVARRLKAAGIANAQITLDGDQKIHNQRRPLRGGHGTFDRILENLAAVRDILEIQIRVNIDRGNVKTAPVVLDILVEHGLQGVHVNFGHVQPFTDACASIAPNCFSNEQFGQINLELTRQAVARGFMSLDYPQSQLGGICGADHEFGYVVAADGLLFKCWAQASLGPEHSVGDILTNEVSPRQAQNRRLFLDWNPLNDAACQQCQVLPICMGGCPYKRLNSSLGGDCGQWRHLLLDTLALRYKIERLVKELSYQSSSEGGKGG